MRSTSPADTDQLGHDEAAGTDNGVQRLHRVDARLSKRHFWGGTRGKEPNTDSLYNEDRRRVIPVR
ncbi:hypothetical protein AN948_03540 [Rhodococcus sp. ADH]|nr:hypothetical protein AN948_03540 [Rhodococcus sp. ADH]